jgi:hypothetical protein
MFNAAFIMETRRRHDERNRLQAVREAGAREDWTAFFLRRVQRRKPRSFRPLLRVFEDAG